jgi:hypothetical protein
MTDILPLEVWAGSSLGKAPGCLCRTVTQWPMTVDSQGYNDTCVDVVSVGSS